MKKVDVSNQKFGKLTAVSFSHMDKHKKSIWIFNCDCGQTKVCGVSDVKAGKIVSCGCRKRENAIANQKLPKMTSGPKVKHSKCGTSEYNIWKSMRQRCLNPKSIDYPLYGGRGIKICSSWDDFNVFISDMGSKPTPNHSIDRINNDLDYCKDNCRWATAFEQRMNQRRMK